ncbi:hypothetical protein C8P63_10942 [Melghirimyces profundicolus]|uniref:Uncharacterized protein n=1 Tax=Melghirimyces profundicolus TaxID=1242148 RepID=A0A2T6BW19_9BACL|nr:hypothetical protein [Melghirimyces profundicolus]PTX60278.1 hypothetical protein C8P63_10942 [Melghirimyces profundicolus]
MTVDQKSLRQGHARPALARFWKALGSALWNLTVLVLPVALLIQSLHWLQDWFFHKQGALYFHSYQNGDSRTAFILMILLTVFFQFQLLKNGIRRWREILRRNWIPLVALIPLFLLLLDSYILVNDRGMVHSSFLTLGRESTRQWEDVDKITVGYTLGDEYEKVFTGSYLLQFKDGDSLEIWNGGGMGPGDLRSIHRLAMEHNIPLTIQSPLSPDAMEALQTGNWSLEDRQFLTELFHR